MLSADNERVILEIARGIPCSWIRVWEHVHWFEPQGIENIYGRVKNRCVKGKVYHGSRNLKFTFCRLEEGDNLVEIFGVASKRFI